MTISVSKPAKGLREAIVEIIGRGASVINGMTKGDAQDELEVSRKNWIINGDMQVSQRGDYTSATAVTDTTYYLDRWRSDEKTVACTVQQTTVTLPNGVVTKAIKTAATATGTGRIGATQHIEDVDSLEGQTVTVSFWMRSNNPYANCNIYQDGFATSWVDHNGDGEWQKVTQTVTLNSSITTFSLLVRLQNGASNVSITSGDYIEFTNVKLEIGDTATPFESRSYAEELALCQRYFFSSTHTSAHNTVCTYAHTSSNSEVVASFNFPVRMRIEPSCLVQNKTNIYFRHQDNSGFTLGSAGTYSIGETTDLYGTVWFNSQSSSGSRFGHLRLLSSGSKTGFEFDAEL